LSAVWDALSWLRRGVVESERVLDLDDLGTDRGVMDVVAAEDYVIGEAPAPDRRRDGQRAMHSWRDLR
jgi:hypothetical protein